MRKISLLLGICAAVALPVFPAQSEEKTQPETAQPQKIKAPEEFPRLFFWALAQLSEAEREQIVRDGHIPLSKLSREKVEAFLRVYSDSLFPNRQYPRLTDWEDWRMEVAREIIAGKNARLEIAVFPEIRGLKGRKIVGRMWFSTYQSANVWKFAPLEKGASLTANSHRREEIRAALLPFLRDQRFIKTSAPFAPERFALDGLQRKALSAPEIALVDSLTQAENLKWDALRFGLGWSWSLRDPDWDMNSMKFHQGDIALVSAGSAGFASNIGYASVE